MTPKTSEKILKSSLTTEQIEQLFSVIKLSIEQGLQGQRLQFDSNEYAQNASVYPSVFSKPAATFVTLHHNSALRGCIGSLQAYRSLIEDIAGNAFSAAFQDPRFAPLAAHELSGLEVEHSILSTPEIIECGQTKQGLLERLVPDEDGLIISEGIRRATFLPSVWSQLPDKSRFVEQLMLKAGISKWSDSIICERYSVSARQKKWRDIA